MHKIEVPEDMKRDNWARMPQPGNRLEGLSRGTLIELGAAKKIRSVVLRKPGAIRGIRLVYLPSLHAYLESLEKQEASV